MKYISLFSGIGAFEKALDNIGIDYELINFCEFDKYATKSYCAVHGVDESKNLGDITAVDEKTLSKDVDLITYGFPCQDISVAGKGKGFFDENGNTTRSGLFFEALRIIEETQPKYAIAENVKNLTSKKFATEFEIVLDALNEAGYNNYWKVLNSKDYGIPQNRERVFIVSIRKDIDDGTFKFPEGFPLELRLKDMLEDEVDESYFLNETQIERIRTTTYNVGKTRIQEKDWCDTLCARDYKDPKCVKVADFRSLSGNTFLIKENTKKGYVEATEGDSINLSFPTSTTRRGRVGHQVAQTLTTSCNQAVVEPRIDVIGNYSPSGHDASRIVSSDGLAPTVKENHGTVTATNQGLRIRKLTPKECWRLQGFDDESFERAAKVNSNTQLYKQAGNSITVKVLEYLLGNLLIRK